ncbi:MAG TPA: GNAT family N-acetyltransferase [Thermoanaerobaculia bacterium]
METQALSSRPVAEHTSAEVAEALTRSFEGYVVPLRFTPQAYERRFRGEDLDPYASRVYERDGEPAGVVLIARRGWTCRVAAMGLAPDLRGGGLGRRVMETAIAEARARGDRTMLLEVIEGNAPAVALYKKLGFAQSRRLVGFRWEPPPLEVPETFEEMDPLDFARLVAREGEADLPWNLAPETLSAASSPARAFGLGDRACALIADPDAERIVLTALIVPKAHRRQGWGTRLLHALSAAFPGRPWAITPVVPEGLADQFFAALGWERHALSQLEMVLDL